MNKNIISISKGPQFRNGKSAGLVVLLVLMFFVLLTAIIQVWIIHMLILIPIMVVVIFTMLDIRGIQIDKKKGLIRSYKLHIFGKYGKWVNFTLFNTIYLDYETYKLKHTSYYRNPYRSSTHIQGHFVVTLINNDEKKNIVLAQKPTHKEAIEFARSLLNKIKLPFTDNFVKKVHESKKKRGIER